MRASITLPVLAFCVSGCATLPASQRTPFLPPGVYGVYEDNDIGALQQSAWAFASAANTLGNPIEAARAVIALEYLPGELKENPRWIGMDSAVKSRMAQARDEVRRILGIRPDAPAQLVVNALLAFDAELGSGNRPAALQTLASAVFTLPPDRTLQLLSNLPYVQVANLATSRAEAQELPVGGPRS